MAVFKVDQNFEFVLNADAVKLVPELSNLDQKELMYVILVADIVDGPYRKKPYEERLLMAYKRVYGSDKVNVTSDKFKIAIEAYKSLVFDIRRETIDIYNSKIRELQKETLQHDTTFSRMKEIDSTISFMMERITRINHEIDIEEGEEIELRGKKKLSYLEIWQRNQKAFREFKASR
jgi:hypothetical protein